MILTPKDISQRLSSRCESYVEYLLPNGKKSSGEWCVGSVGGEAGDSLKVRISGDKAGIWADFAGTDKGDLLDLTAAVKNISLGEAIKFAKDWLGIRDPESLVPKKTYAKPAPKAVTKLTVESPVTTYLRSERMLNGSIIKLFRVSEANRGTEIAFPSFSPLGDLVNVKYIALKRDERGKKIIRQEKGCAPSLFGWHVVPKDRREVLICEGQIDAMTWKQMGFDALSVPDGVASDEWIDYDWDNLQQFDSIYLAFDNDDPGQKAVQKVASRLGYHRCLIVKFEQWKDANEALQKGATEKDFMSAVARAKPIAPGAIKAPLDFLSRVIEKFHPPDGVLPGFGPTLLDQKIRFRPGEATVWSGISGHGKSVLLSQLFLEAIHCGERVAMASMEMKGEQNLYRMICQAELNTGPSREQIESILRWLGGKLWIYDLIGNVQPQVLFELMEYSYARHGVSQFLIDSLMKTSVKSDDYDAQRMFLNDVCSFAMKNGVHVHVVAHARKGKDESESPGKMDVKGSSDIINQPDNILIVQRNKEKEEKKENDDLRPGDDENLPDAFVTCTKQRETGVEFKKKLHFFKKIFRFNHLGQQSFDNLSVLEKLDRDQKWESARMEPEPPGIALEPSEESSAAFTPPDDLDAPNVTQALN